MKRERLQNSKKRIFIADNHPIVREGLKMIINHEKDLEVCGEADEGWEANKSISELKPDVVVVDIILKNSDGFELTKNLKARCPKLPVIIFSTHDEFSYAERTLRAGALAYLMKEVATENIINAIRSVLSGEIYVSDAIAKKLLRKVTAGKSDTILTPMDYLDWQRLQTLQDSSFYASQHKNSRDLSVTRQGKTNPHRRG